MPSPEAPEPVGIVVQADSSPALATTSTAEDRQVRQTECERIQSTTSNALQPVQLTDRNLQSQASAGRQSSPDAAPPPEAGRSTSGDPRPDAPPAPGADRAPSPGPPPSPREMEGSRDPFLAIPHRLDRQLQNDTEMKNKVNQMLLSWLVSSLTLHAGGPVGTEAGASPARPREDEPGVKPPPQPEAPKAKPPLKAPLRSTPR
jgi:hypothetical protein